MSKGMLPEYRLSVPIKGAKSIEKGRWASQPVKGTLKTENQSYETTVKYRGAHIRKFPKKSYDFVFPSSRMFTGAKRIHMNAEYNDPSLMRNKLSLDFFRDIGVLSPEANHVTLYINGFYQGVYLQLESVDQLFLKKRGLPDGSIYYAISENANFSKYNPTTGKAKRSVTSGYEIKYDPEHSFHHLRKLLNCVLTSTDKEFPTKIEPLLNLESYFRWLGGAVCTQNFDGFIHNYSLYKNGETGQFEIMPWDYDATWGRDIHGDVMENKYVPIEGYNTLTARLLLHGNYRRQYRHVMEQLLEEAFTIESMEWKIEKLYASIRPHIIKDPYKHYSLSKFDKEPEYILAFIKKRNKYLKKRLHRLQ
ncbi:CotH kinase family protein [Fictibacillus enclensis]|uniref:CotH kinase family protein n=1 Tax=Fictibacillus enclensis TaxID=1017270 RepID=UPI0024BFB3AD|nr:CotH kinase family protein [Fictibacillus enclensis]WHY71082.1 CotH kinase family protein [Fictibacillus enclensis]